MLSIYYQTLTHKGNNTPTIHMVLFVFIMIVVLLVYVTGFLIWKDLFILSIIGIKALADMEVDAEELADAKKYMVIYYKY